MTKDFAKKSKKNVIMLKIPLSHCDGGGWGLWFRGGEERSCWGGRLMGEAYEAEGDD